MGTEGIEPPADGLEPSVLPLNYAPILLRKKSALKSFSFAINIALNQVVNPQKFS